jgi:hypothetical protein
MKDVEKRPIVVVIVETREYTSVKTVLLAIFCAITALFVSTSMNHFIDL